MGIVEKKVTQVSGALQLGISVRHIRRLQRRYAVGGNSGLLWKSSGGNRGFSGVFKEQCLEIIRRDYADFSPLLAAEKLGEDHGLCLVRWFKLTAPLSS